MNGHSIEEDLVTALRELPVDKQQEVLDFANVSWIEAEASA